MTRYLLAGGGTAGHVNPLLAVAARLRDEDSTSQVIALGTASGLESRLVPAQGYELVTIDKVPLPRRLGVDVLRFPGKFRGAVRDIRSIIKERNIDVVVGFGGFVSAPAYVAAWRERRPIVVHEANAVPGFANRVGSLLTQFVGVAFPGTRLRHAHVVGMPLSRALETLDPLTLRADARRFFGFENTKRVLLVTGGSQGARSINETVSAAIASILGAGWNVLHIVGNRSELHDTGLPGYRIVGYCDRMDLAFSAAEFVIARAGSATVSELTAIGIPAVYVPLPIGNGEQRRNAASVAQAGGAIILKNADFTPEWVRHELVPLLHNSTLISEMGARASSQGMRDGTARTVALIAQALEHSKAGTVDQD